MPKVRKIARLTSLIIALFLLFIPHTFAAKECEDGGGTCGEVNGDGKVDLADVIVIARSYFGHAGFVPDPIECADIDDKGGANLADCILLAKYVLGQVPDAPSC